MSDQITVQEKEEIIPRLTGIIWGLTGCGKTSLLSTLPQPILFVMLDPDGKDSIPSNIDYKIIDLTTLTDGETVRALKDKVPRMLEQQDEIKSVVVDSLTILSERGLNYAIEQKIGESRKSNFIPTIEAPGLQAYGARRQYIIQAVSNILRATAKKHQNCFFTTHDTEVVDETGKLIKYTMMLGGKANNDVGLKISECWWMREHEKKWFIAVRNCRSREPIKSRIFDVSKASEFEIKFKPELGEDQPHSIASFYKMWLAAGGSGAKIPLPDTKEYEKFYGGMNE